MKPGKRTEVLGNLLEKGNLALMLGRYLAFIEYFVLSARTDFSKASLSPKAFKSQVWINGAGNGSLLGRAHGSGLQEGAERQFQLRGQAREKRGRHHTIPTCFL